MLKIYKKLSNPIRRNIHLSSTLNYDTEEYDFKKKPIKKHIEEDKARLKWRTPINENPNEWSSKFKLFAPEDDRNSTLITLFQQPFDISPSGLKKWKKNRDENIERQMQQFIPQRHEMLGNDLAAAHFIIHRGGSVKFCNHKIWNKKDENGEYILPGHFDAKYKIEAIKCDDMLLYYEGLENIRRLNYLKFLSFHNVPTFDDWCLDRVSGSQFDVLEVLDLSKTNITEKGLHALYRIDTLKLLIIDNVKKNKGMELVCSMLEELFPNLKIVEGNTIH